MTGECVNCGAAKADDRYRACDACRSYWRLVKRKPDGPANTVERLNRLVGEAVSIIRGEREALASSLRLVDGSLDPSETEALAHLRRLDRFLREAGGDGK